MLLQSFGITIDDVYRGVNDTTNSALRTGLTIADGRCPKVKGTTCQMHTQELVVQHALGIRQRSRNKNAWDYFHAGKSLRDKSRDLVKKIMDKKTKKGFPKFTKFCETKLKMMVRKLEVPNDTRVSGVFVMYESLLRSYRCVTAFCKAEEKDFKDIELNEKEWQFLAETHSILQVMNSVALTSQQESVESNCFSYYQVVTARYYLSNVKKFRVIDLNGYWSPMDDLKKIETKMLLREELLDVTQELICRFEKEFQNYFSRPDSDQLLMMVFNPVIVWMGFE